MDTDVKQHISSAVSFSFESTQDFSEGQLFDIVTQRLQHGLIIDFVHEGVVVVKQGRHKNVGQTGSAIQGRKICIQIDFFVSTYVFASVFLCFHIDFFVCICIYFFVCIYISMFAYMCLHFAYIYVSAFCIYLFLRLLMYFYIAGVIDIVGLLQHIQNNFPNLMHFEMIELTRIYMGKGILEGIPSIPGFPDDVTSGYDVTLTYYIVAGKYTVTVSRSLF